MREQVELKFLIGYDREAALYSMTAAFEREVIQRACELCGGCTVVRSDGYWMSDGAQRQQTFCGRLKKEHTLHIELSCELDKEAHVFETMREFISAHIKLFRIEADWVHAKRTPYTGLHFSAKEQTAQMSVGKFRDIVSPGTNLAHR